MTGDGSVDDKLEWDGAKVTSKEEFGLGLFGWTKHCEYVFEEQEKYKLDGLHVVNIFTEDWCEDRSNQIIIIIITTT